MATTVAATLLLHFLLAVKGCQAATVLVRVKATRIQAEVSSDAQLIHARKRHPASLIIFILNFNELSNQYGNIHLACSAHRSAMSRATK
jgi:hypothetical protein